MSRTFKMIHVGVAADISLLKVSQTTSAYTSGLQAIRKHQRSISKGEVPIEPQVHIPDPSSVRCS